MRSTASAVRVGAAAGAHVASLSLNIELPRYTARAQRREDPHNKSAPPPFPVPSQLRRSVAAFLLVTLTSLASRWQTKLRAGGDIVCVEPVRPPPRP